MADTKDAQGKRQSMFSGMKKPNAADALRSIRQNRERFTGEGHKAAGKERRNDPNVKPSVKRELLRYSPIKGSKARREIHAENAAEKNATNSNIARLREEAEKRIRGGSNNESSRF